MPMQFENELSCLRKMVLQLWALVEKNCRRSMRSFVRADLKGALLVVEEDQEIDRLESAIEERCLSAIALHHPVARDLRLLIALLRINNELERIGDLAVKVAKRVPDLVHRSPDGEQFRALDMFEKACALLSRALDSYIKRDAAQAYRIWLDDDEVDELNRAAYGVFKSAVARRPERVNELLSLLETCQFLERLCDHITTIAKEIIFLIEGEIKRHRKRQALRCWIATVEGEESPSSAPSISTLFAGTPNPP